MITHRARSFLEQYARGWPGVWALVDAYRAQHRGEWPEEIFLPTTHALEVVYAWGRAQGLPPPSEEVYTRETMTLAALASWRVSQGIYRIDADLLPHLMDTPLSGELPAQLLLRLPEWCIYLETPGLALPTSLGTSVPLHGVWAMADEEPRGPLLLLLCDTERGAIGGHVRMNGTLEQSLASIAAEWDTRKFPADYIEKTVGAMSPILSMLLYICAEVAQMPPERRPSRPVPKRTKGRERHFPPPQPIQWDIGVRMGAALRRALQEPSAPGEPTGRTVRPHVRRAHWHTFLAGEDRSYRRVKWLPPIPVKLDDPEQLPAVVRPVGGPRRGR